MFKATVCFVLICFVVNIYSQSNPPLLEGQWDDTVCNLVPLSAQIYRRRSLTYGRWNNAAQLGSWEYREIGYQGTNCTQETEDYEVTYFGTYHLSGKESEFVEKFWHAEYQVTRQVITVFTDDFANYINNLHGCSFPSRIFANVQQVIDDVTCTELNIQPIEECPVQFDIVRRQNDRIYIGDKYPGTPPYYLENCSSNTRPRIYDNFGFLLFGSVQDGSSETSFTSDQSTFDFDPFINDNNNDLTDFALTTQLGFSTLPTNTDGSSMIVVSLLSIVFSLFVSVLL
eukprot:TRINITY_DN80283_c0_g1_i1.p1 TRINITY_DN80283_c0_g1~~TRINITY_DN80283_c0_g1_i1.p1  ORF type:complete len:299 (-),score=66.16 TRINITY_DN80283_c0_g1_i1:60-914(-)